MNSYRLPLEPQTWPVALSHPASVGGHPQARAGEVYAELALGTVGRAVAVAGLAVRNDLAAKLRRKLEVVS